MTDTPTHKFPDKIDDMVEHYVRLRDTIKAAEDQHKKKMAPAKEYLEQLGNAMLAKLNEVGGDSVKTGAGTVYRITKKSASIADSALFRQFIINTEQYDLVDMRANAPAVEEFISGVGQGNPPPGVNFSTFTQVGVRRPDGKDDK